MSLTIGGGGGGSGATPSGSAPPAIAATGATGAATTFAKGDHTHAHSALSDPTHHALVTTSSHGFMSSSDKTTLDGLSASTGLLPWNSGTTYAAGAVVTYKNATFISKVGSNLNSSPANQSFWAPSGLPIYNAEWFGVVADGVTDDTAALQLAINAATRGSLYLPGRDIRITKRIVYDGTSAVKPNGFGGTMTTPVDNLRLFGGNAESDGAGGCRIIYDGPQEDCAFYISSRGNVFENFNISVKTGRTAYTYFVLTKLATSDNNYITRNTWRNMTIGAISGTALGNAYYGMSLGNDPTNLLFGNAANYTEQGLDYNTFDNVRWTGYGFGEGRPEAAFRVHSVFGNSFHNLFRNCVFSGLKKCIWMRSGDFQLEHPNFSYCFDAEQADVGYCVYIQDPSGPCSIYGADGEGIPNLLYCLPTGSTLTGTFTVERCRFAGVRGILSLADAQTNPGSSSTREFIRMDGNSPQTLLLQSNVFGLPPVSWNASAYYPRNTVVGLPTSTTGTNNSLQWSAATTYGAGAQVRCSPPSWSVATAYITGQGCTFSVDRFPRVFTSVAGGTGGTPPETNWSSEYTYASGDVVTIYPKTWDSTASYVVGDTVTYLPNGLKYRCTSVPPVGTLPTNASYFATFGGYYTSQAAANINNDPRVYNATYWIPFTGTYVPKWTRYYNRAFYYMSAQAGNIGNSPTNNPTWWKPMENGNEVYYVAPTWDVGTAYPANRTVIYYGVPAYASGGSYAVNDTVSYGGERFYCTSPVAVADPAGTGNAPSVSVYQGTNWKIFSSHYYNNTGSTLTGGAAPGGTALGSNWTPIDVEEIFYNTNTTNANNWAKVGVPPADFGSGWTSVTGIGNTSKGSEEFRIKAAGYGYYNFCNTQIVSLCNTYPTQNFIERVDYADCSPFSLTSLGDVCFDVLCAGGIKVSPGSSRIEAGRYAQCRNEIGTNYLHITEANTRNVHHTSLTLGRVTGISGTNITSKNNSGPVTIANSALTTGTVTFPNGAETDANFEIMVTQPRTTAGGIQTTKVTVTGISTTGFTYSYDVAPSTSTIAWAWKLIRYEK